MRKTAAELFWLLSFSIFTTALHRTCDAASPAKGNCTKKRHRRVPFRYLRPRNLPKPCPVVAGAWRVALAMWGSFMYNERRKAVVVEKSSAGVDLHQVGQGWCEHSSPNRLSLSYSCEFIITHNGSLSSIFFCFFHGNVFARKKETLQNIGAFTCGVF